MSSVERLGLLPRASISIAILQLRTIIGVVSSLPALVTGDMTQVLLSGCCWIGTVLVATCSISIPIFGATMVMRTSSIVSVSSMVVVGVSSRVRGKMRSLLSS